jgi:intraflagellar transport protein 22
MRLKICVVGPKGVGKTWISNYLAGQTPSLVTEGNYEPTAGARILEYEAHTGQGNVGIELWDASGDTAFEGCWRAIMHEADGVVLIYNPDAPSQDQQIGDWFEFFVRKNNLREDQCIVFAYRSNPSNGDKFRPRKSLLPPLSFMLSSRHHAAPLFSKVNASLTTPQNCEDMKGMFSNFVNELASIRQRK